MKKKKNLKKVGSRYGINEYRLENGLRVLYKKISAVPLVTVCITFHVGSRNEVRGHTGATHILEHLLFKDSKNFNVKNGKSITNYLELFGAKMNATTWVDRTNYFEMLPKEHLSKALALEADRLRNALFNDADLKSEMTVVRNEYERSRNNPFEIIDEAMMETAFTVHPYRIPTIGFKEDIESSTATKLREFYDCFYWPNNATLSILGDVSETEIKKLVIKYFASIPSSPRTIPTMNTVEPIQKKPREITIKKPGDVSVVGLLYKTPRGTDADYPAVLIIANILAGGFSSRLNKKLVDTSLAANVWFFTHPFHDPGPLTFFAHLTPESNPRKIITFMREVCLGFDKKPITLDEIKRAKERILADLAEEHDGIFAETRALSESIAAGDWRLRYQLEERIKKLTLKDIIRVYKKYIISSNETSGLLLKN